MGLLNWLFGRRAEKTVIDLDEAELSEADTDELDSNAENKEWLTYPPDVARQAESIWHRLLEVRHGKLHSPAEILNGRIEVPKNPGIYAWYFDRAPGLLSDIGCDGWTPLYVGIAPRNSRSTGDLYTRIREKHLGKRLNASTLRFSLAYLLHEEEDLRIRLSTASPSSYWLGDEGETILTDWMKTHARVFWQEHDQPWGIEDLIVEGHGELLPLNIKGNRKHRLPDMLSEERSAWRRKCLVEGT